MTVSERPVVTWTPSVPRTTEAAQPTSRPTAEVGAGEGTPMRRQDHPGYRIIKPIEEVEIPEPELLPISSRISTTSRVALLTACVGTVGLIAHPIVLSIFS